MEDKGLWRSITPNDHFSMHISEKVGSDVRIRIIRREVKQEVKQKAIQFTPQPIEFKEYIELEIIEHMLKMRDKELAYYLVDDKSTYRNLAYLILDQRKN